MNTVTQDPTLLNEDDMKIISIKVEKLLKSNSLIPGQDREDLRQDLALDLIQRLEKFDPAKTDRRRFINVVIDRKIANIIRYRFCESRDPRLEAYSMDEFYPDNDSDDSWGLNQDDIDGITNKNDKPRWARTELALDVESTIALMPAALGRFCELLIEGYSITDAAEQVGFSTAGGYRKIEELLEIFSEAGLHDHL